MRHSKALKNYSLALVARCHDILKFLFALGNETSILCLMCNDANMMNGLLWRGLLKWRLPKQFRRFAGAAMLLLFLGSPVLAGETVHLIGAKGLSGNALLAGVEMTMEPGWHTYWRHPGDSGIAPTFDWSKSENVANIELLWPAPRRFDQPDDLTVGYEGHIVWPVLVRPLDPARPVKLHLSMHYGVCSDICVPGEADLFLTLPEDATGEGGEMIRQFLARVPAAPRDDMRITAHAVEDHLTVSISAIDEDPALIVEGPRGIWFGKPVAERDGKSIRYIVPFERTGDAKLEGADVGLIFSGTHTAIKATRKVE